MAVEKLNKKSLFDLTPEDIEASKLMYEGKIIKCLVAPYHSYNSLEKEIEYTPTTYLFPEREASILQIKQLISRIVANPKITEKTEVKIITTNMNIMMDMIDTSVRILTEKGNVVRSPEKTFMANIHTLRLKLLENEAHQIGKEERNRATADINDMIEKVIAGKDKGIKQAEYDVLKTKIDKIGEPLIRTKLKDMLCDVIISDGISKEERRILELQAELDALERSKTSKT